MIKFKTARIWKDNRVKPGDAVIGTRQEMEDLVACGQAYDEIVTPDESSTKAEIKAYLDFIGKEYDKNANKAELLECSQSD